MHQCSGDRFAGILGKSTKKSSSLRRGVIFFLFWNSVVSFAEEAKFTVDQVLSEAPASLYSVKIANFSKKFKIPEVPELETSKNPVITWGIKTPEHSLYIGSAKRLWIVAPIEKVLATLDKFSEYPHFFEDVEKVEVRAKEGNKWVVFWERNSPAFFIPNIKYELVYVIEQLSPTRVIYRYQLKKGNSLHASDGIILVEGKEKGTLVSGIDFYDASWGLAGALASGKIWRKSLEGGYKGDLSLKFHIEHPEWKFDQIKKEAEKMLDRYPIEPIQYLAAPQWD